MKIRIVPVVVVAALLVVILKLDAVLGTRGKYFSSFFVGELHAADDEEEESVVEEEIIFNPKDYKGPTVVQPSDVSKKERELLEGLAKRREELEEWGRSIALRENILNATERKINQKMEELKNLKSEVASLLKEYNEKEDRKIKSLVKIYENMKPKDAAKIFEEVELPILLQVIDRMREAKAAPIIANMDPKKARILTIELAKQRRLPE